MQDLDDEQPTLEWSERSGIRSKLERPRPAAAPDLSELAETGEHCAAKRLVGDRYVLREMLGVGGMGTVVAALDTVTGREVALKLLRTNRSRETHRRRMQREAEAAMSIDDAFVCRVDEMSAEGAQPFIVMERLHGETLRERLRREGPLAFAEAIEIVSQLLDALDAVHEAGVIHRDVKPANVFLARDSVKLIDFGVAVRAGDVTSDARKESMNAFGTLDYLAPERLLESRFIDHRVDLWAAGLTLYVALTGEHPFRRDPWQAQVQATLLDDPPLVSRLRGDVPSAVDRVLATALAKEPERRFASARAFRAALRAAAGSVAA